MFGLGTIINAAAIIGGGIIGHFAGKLFKENTQQAAQRACGISTLFISLADVSKIGDNAMLVVICVAFGSIIGEFIGIEAGLERFGEYLKHKSGNSNDGQFVDAFVTASMTVCIGAMAIVGSIQDGILHDYTTLVVKSILDFIIIIVMTSSMGKGCVFSVIPVVVIQGSVTLLSKVIEPYMTELAIANLSLVGSVLIGCIGINLIFGQKFRVANMIPAIFLAVAAAYI